MSMPGPAPSVYSPFIIWGIPRAYSTTSTPRRMSPLASGSVLPCSRASNSASASLSRATNSRNFISTRTRRCGLVAPHSGCAALAFSTAARSSALEASATRAWTVPVIGSKTSAVRPDVPLTSRPPIKCPIERICSSNTSRAGFAGILQSLRRLERVSTRGGFAEMQAWAALRWHSTNGVGRYRRTQSMPGVYRGVFGRSFLRGRLCRHRATEHGLASGVENLVGKVAVAGNPGHYQRPHHGRDRSHRLLARGLARNLRDLQCQHVDHLLQLGGK